MKSSQKVKKIRHTMGTGAELNNSLGSFVISEKLNESTVSALSQQQN